MYYNPDRHGCPISRLLRHTRGMWRIYIYSFLALHSKWLEFQIRIFTGILTIIEKAMDIIDCNYILFFRTGVARHNTMQALKLLKHLF
jgi:hypothetical protein